MRRALPLLALLSACATPRPEPPSVASSGYLAMSAPSPAWAAPTPVAEAAPGELVVRPDTLAINYAYRAKGDSATSALAALRREVEALAVQVEAASKGAAKVVPCGLRLERGGAVEIAHGDGRIEANLPEGADYWQRAQLLAALTEVTRALQSDDGAKKSDSSETSAGFASPRVYVADPEGHRQALFSRWSERARAFAEAARAGGPKLEVVQCEPPGAIHQRVLSLQEVGLSLPVQCRLRIPSQGASLEP